MPNSDIQLIKQLNMLPDNYWDFRGSDTRQLTHGFHNYPAMMIYPISRTIIGIVGRLKPISSLLDPFAGAGTVLVEGIRAGIPTIYGNDLNPLATLLSEVKTHPIEGNRLSATIEPILNHLNEEFRASNKLLSQVNSYVIDECGLDISERTGWGSNAHQILSEYLAREGSSLQVPDFRNMGYWFKPDVVLSLQIIKDHILRCKEEDIRRFLWVAFSDVVRTVSNRRSGEFKMFRRPANRLLAYSPDPLGEFERRVRENMEGMEAFSKLCLQDGKTSDVHISASDARELKYVPDESVDLLITSPPYGDSRTTVAYGEFSRVSLQWLELDEFPSDAITTIDRNLMGGTKYRNGYKMNLGSNTLRAALAKISEVDLERAGDVYSFYRDLDDSLKCIARKMKVDSYLFWVVGNRTVKKVTLETDRIVAELAAHHGLRWVHSFGRSIPNKVMPSMNSPTNEPGKKVATMTNEHIVVLKRE